MKGFGEYIGVSDHKACQEVSAQMLPSGVVGFCGVPASMALAKLLATWTSFRSGKNPGSVCMQVPWHKPITLQNGLYQNAKIELSPVRSLL